MPSTNEGWPRHILEIVLIITYGVEVIELIKFVYGQNVLQTVLVIFTVIAQNYSVWRYLKSTEQKDFWKSLRAAVMTLVSITITSTAIHYVPATEVDLVITIIMISILNIFFFLHH